jgi:serine/threonine protein kinase
MVAPATIEAFLELGLQSGLLEQKVVETFRQQSPETGAAPETPKQLAEAMVRDGLLTTYQAENLLAGRWRGFLINHKYRLLHKVGSGGMGSVYLCEHIHMRRRVALKVLPLAQAQDPEAVERFYREARAVASLDHPNIVRAHDIDHEGSLHFLVLEYIDGSNLHDIIRRCGPMPIVRAANYIRQAALGLQHAHESGLVHRDIKPGNLLLDRNGVIKVLDMGLARFFHEPEDNLSDDQEVGNVLGTADFLAPEQVQDSRVDIRADVYSLGVTFYFLLSGKSPFHEGTVSQKLIWHQVRQPKPIRALRPEVPDELVQVLERMLAKNAAERYQTPAEVAQALAPWTQTAIAPPPEEEMPSLGLARGVQPSSANTPIARVMLTPALGRPPASPTSASGPEVPPVPAAVAGAADAGPRTPRVQMAPGPIPANGVVKSESKANVAGDTPAATAPKPPAAVQTPSSSRPLKKAAPAPAQNGTASAAAPSPRSQKGTAAAPGKKLTQIAASPAKKEDSQPAAPAPRANPERTATADLQSRMPALDTMVLAVGIILAVAGFATLLYLFLS